MPMNRINVVLNLVINGLPSIHNGNFTLEHTGFVLNLVINGLPSILKYLASIQLLDRRFKPCYKWITFNT